MYAGTNIVHPRNVGFRRIASAILFIFEGGDYHNYSYIIHTHYIRRDKEEIKWITVKLEKVITK